MRRLPPRIPFPYRLAFAPALILALALSACSRGDGVWAPDSADPSTRRTPPAGEVLGAAGRYGSQAWLGIPYAKPPLGERRWRAPEAPEAWSGVREAVSFGAPCPQYVSPFGGVAGEPGTVVGDEDCLTLNLWTPPYAPGDVPQGDARLPVLVWIHGGGNSIGSATFYDGGRLAADGDVVVVTVQYRLGPLGWFRHAALRADAAGPAEASGNFATLDLVRALEWVRDNVSAFGGDPDNVTIFGESAGGQNVFTLLLAPQARGLFHRAIVQSGGLWRATPSEAEHLADAAEPGAAQSSGEIVLRLLEADGAADRDAARERLAAMDEAEVASFLRSRTATQVLEAYQADPSGMIRMPKVFADGAVLHADDLESRFARADGWNRVPVVLGTNRDENRLFMYPDPQHVRQWLWIFPRFVDEERFLVTSEYLSRMWKATGADVPARAMRQSSPDVYVYRFDWDEEPSLLGADLSKMLGAAHGFEIPFVFGHFDLGRAGNVIFTDGNAPGREALSEAMRGYWVAFARDGRPGRGADGDGVAWTAWDESAPAGTTLVLDTEADGGIRMTGGVETPEAVLAALESDPRLFDPERRCDVLRSLASGSRGYTAEQYAQRQECAAFPMVAGS